MVFHSGSFGFSYNHSKAKKNGNIIQEIKVNKDQFKIVTLDFIFSETLNYDIKCVDYAIFYKMNI